MNTSTGNFTSKVVVEPVRFRDWKAIRQPMFTGAIELYDLRFDLEETTERFV